MKSFLTVITLLLVNICTFAAAPEAAIILLDDREKVIVNSDGTSTTVDKCVYRILNYEGLQRMRTLQLHFNSSYGSIRISHLALVKADGRRIVLDPEKLSSVKTESSQLASEIFDPAQKVLWVNIPGMEIGDTLEVTSEEKVTKSRLPGQWSDIAVLQADFPIKRYEYIVDLPEDRPLAGICVKNEVPGSLSFEKKQQNGRIIYTWTAKDVPQAVPEPAMPPMYTEVQRVLVSTVKSWEDISRWYDRLCAPRLAKVNDAMRRKTEELISGKKSDADRIMALFQFVSQQIRYTGVTAEESAPGYEPHDVDQTFNQRHGVCRDKAALLAAMLRLAGFKAYPTLFMANSPKDKEVANIYFNHAIVAVEDSPGKYILMDPTFETTTELFPGYLAGFPYLVAKPEGDTLRTAEPVKAERNLLEIDTVVSGSLVEMNLKFSGTYDNMFRGAFSEWTAEDTEHYFAGAISRIMPGAEFGKVEISPANVRDMSQKLSVKLSFSMPERELPVSQPSLLAMPRAGIIFGMLNSFFNAVSLEKRRFSLRVMPRAVREKITMDPDGGFRYELPEDISLSAKGLYRISRKTFLSGGKLHEEFFTALDTMLVPPDDYGKFRNAADILRNRSQIFPIAEKKREYTAEGSDAEILKLQRHYRIIDQDSWEQSVHSVTRIRNYAGMKRHANRTIAFVEKYGKPEIKAEVTDSKGKKYQLAAKDIQYMDDDRLASAPRYAKRKLAVVTLPGVDAGSVINMTNSRKVFRRGFYHELLTQNILPVKENVSIIEHPAKMKLKISAVPPQIKDASTFGGKRIIRRYFTGDSPKIAEESRQPDYSLFVPALIVSNADARELYRRYVRLAEKQTASASEEIGELVKKITAGKTDILAKIEVVEKYVYRHIKEIDLPLNEMLDSDFSAPQVTLRDGYGNSADRAVLLAAMLRVLGVKYEFEPVSNEVYTAEQLEQLKKYPQDIFTGLLLKIDAGGREIYLNDGGSYADTGTLYHHNFLSLNKNGISMLHSLIQFNNRRWLSSVKLNADLSAQVVIKYFPQGIYLAELRESFAGFTRQTAAQFFEKYASGIAPQSKILESRFEKDHLLLKLHIRDFAKRSGRFVSMPLPGFSNIAAEMAISSRKRQTPWLNSSNSNILFDCEISVPENFRIVKPGSANLAVGGITFGSDYGFFNGKHIIGFMLDQKSGIFSTDNFEYLRKLQSKINHFSTENILFTVE